MKKITLLLVAIVATFSLNAKVVFNETFGAGPVDKTFGPTNNRWPYLDQYDGYDNASTCEFKGYNVSIRQQKADAALPEAFKNPYAFFAAGKEDTLSISGIKGGESLSLSFDVASFGADQPSTGLKVLVNNQALVVPNETIKKDEYITLKVNVPNAENIVLQFLASSLPSQIYLDNIKIEDGATAVENVEANKLAAFVANDVLYVNAEEGAAVRMYSVTGALVLNGVVNNGQVALNGLNNGIYVINVNNQVAKVTVR